MSLELKAFGCSCYLIFGTDETCSNCNGKGVCQWCGVCIYCHKFNPTPKEVKQCGGKPESFRKQLIL